MNPFSFSKNWLEKFSTGPQLSEYVQVVCRNTNGTCLKSVSKPPTFRFFRDFHLFQHPAKLAKLRPNLGQYWPKRAIFKFPRKTKAAIFFGLQRLGFLQKIRKFQCTVFEKKILKTPIFGYFGPKRPILDHFWLKRGHFRIFGEKAKTSRFYSFFFIFQYKKSENSNARIFGKMGTYVRRNGGESEGPSTPSRDKQNSE